jgi:hypothetical protein
MTGHKHKAAHVHDMWSYINSTELQTAYVQTVIAVGFLTNHMHAACWRSIVLCMTMALFTQPKHTLYSDT